MRTAVVAMWLSVAGVLAAVPSPSVMTTPMPRLERMVVVAPAETLAVMVPAEVRRAGAHVVLLPGVLGSAFSMRHITRLLEASGHAVVVIDPLGMGASGRPLTANYSLAAQAQRVRAVLDTLGWTQVIVAGQGTSATIALHLAAQSPTHVRGVVSMAGGPVSSQRTGGIGTVLRFARLFDNPVGRAAARRRFAKELRARAVRTDWLTPEVEQAYVRGVGGDLRGMLGVLHAMGEAREPEALDVVLARVKVPVRVLVGAVAVPGAPTAEQLGMLVRYVRDVRVDTVPATGVLLHEEAPGVVAGVIGGWGSG
jgi:pimeloyl-ACP methyl ester carboxylesterase